MPTPRPRTRFRILALALALAAAPTAAQSDPPRHAVSAAELRAEIGRIFASGLAPGMAVAVVRDTQLLLLEGFGFADLETRRAVTPATVFYIASATKPFTATAAALLHHEGRIDLDAPLSRWLPGVRMRPPLSADSITLRALLTHTHGVANDGPIVMRTAYTGEHTPERLLELVGELTPAEHGRAFEYGNIGYNIASLALDATLGESWKELLERRIFAPLGMRSTSAHLSRADRSRLAQPYRVDSVGFARLPYAKGDATMHAAGGMVSTAEDAARWIEAQLNAGVVDGQRVLPAAVVAETQRGSASQQREWRGMPRVAYGLGWQLGVLDGDTLVHHYGGFPGFHAHLSFMPGRRAGVVILVNESGAGGLLAEVVARHIYGRLRGTGPDDRVLADSIAALGRMAAEGRRHVAQDLQRRAARGTALPHPPAAYAGTFESPAHGRLELRPVDGGLEARAGLLRSRVEPYDVARNVLRVELIPARGQTLAVRMEGGRAVALELDGVTYTRVPEAR